jgi:hypothetical protein
MQKKLLLLPLVLLLAALFAIPVKAQRSEMGLSGGVAFYLGDLNATKVFSQVNASAGIFYRYNIDTRWALRAGLTYGRIAADDNKTDNPRNLNFRNDIFDVSLMVEVNFLTFFTSNAKYYRFSPYLTAGIAGFFMNPKGHVFGEDGKTQWVSLKSLSTEGQGLPDGPKPYSLASGAFPFGIGFKVALSSKVSLGLEWTMRLSFTDYLDDVKGVYYDNNAIRANIGDRAAYFADPSLPLDGERHVAGQQRGDANTMDWYSFASVTLSIKLSTPEAPCPAYKQSPVAQRSKFR